MSLTTNIPSSILGLSPSQESSETGGFLHGFGEEMEENSEAEMNNHQNGLNNAYYQEEPFSLMSSIKNTLFRLGRKFGYVKKVLKNPEEANIQFSVEQKFQCMTAADEPILIDEQPVFVLDPQDCQKHFIDGTGQHETSEPPQIFIEAARGTFKSKLVQGGFFPMNILVCSMLFLVFPNNLCSIKLLFLIDVLFSLTN